VTILWNNKNLKNSIPAEIGYLTTVQYLYLSGNSLTGSIPATIGRVQSLIGLYLDRNLLTGSIPKEIGNLTNLENLHVYGNQLSGSVPNEIGNLNNLQYLYLTYIDKSWLTETNLNLNGVFTPNCNTKVFAVNTRISICGCAAVNATPSIFPPSTIDKACLATNVATTLVKRTQVYTLPVDTLKLTCNVDDLGNPFQDCLNTMAILCNISYVTGYPDRKTTCKNAIDIMAGNMSQVWRNVPANCAVWKGKSSASPECTAANNDLIARANYTSPIGKMKITSSLTQSMITNLWSNTNLN